GPSHSDSSEDDGHRAPGLHDLVGRGQLAADLIHAKCDDGVAVLIRRVEKSPGRVNREEPGRLTLRRLPADRRERAGGLVDREDGEAVVAPVRRVYEASGRGDLDL